MKITNIVVSLILVFTSLASAAPQLLRRDADFNSVRTKLKFSNNNLDEDSPGKYFHESLFSGHHDGRFAAIALPYDQQQISLRALIQTYLFTMNDLGIETWIMHGTLLGWWWNHKILPWDTDLDVMLAEKSLMHLATFYNMTVHHFHLPEIQERRRYMLEVNPYYANGTADELNMIDARWIDTDTGLFIDITTLRRNWTAIHAGDADAMMVKDKHRYSYDDIFPLRSSFFEGISARVPFAYSEILIEEYGYSALSKVTFASHRFESHLREWVPQRISMSDLTDERE